MVINDEKSEGHSNARETFCVTTKNTLIIEDDQAIRDSLKLALELEGYNVYTASNGQDGINLLKEIPRPCIILLDLMMPVMNGWEFVNVIEDDVALTTIPVVVVSAYSDRAKTIKVDGVIKKPVDLDVLPKTVREFCGGK